MLYRKEERILYEILMIHFYFRLFRYGREDEEVMGLKFCNEAIIALKQIWPRTQETEELSQLQVIIFTFYW